MTLRRRVTSEARANINAIALWWSSNRSNEQAIAWVEAVQQQIQSLAETVAACPHSRENGREGFNYPLFEKPRLRFGLPRSSTHSVFSVASCSNSQRVVASAETGDRKRVAKKLGGQKKWGGGKKEGG